MTTPCPSGPNPQESNAHGESSRSRAGSETCPLRSARTVACPPWPPIPPSSERLLAAWLPDAGPLPPHFSHHPAPTTSEDGANEGGHAHTSQRAAKETVHSW